MPQTVFQRVEEIAREQGRTLEDPCLELGCTLPQLEERVNRLDRAAVEEVAKWLGISYYSFFMKEGEDYHLLLQNRAARRLWDK
jgi:hypothetical protein